jgi:NitT/TauT family transport system substrate-binding protein
LADDSDTELSATVLIFSRDFIKNRSDDAASFLAALNAAVEVINAGGDQVRRIMNRNCRVPKPLETTFPLPRFPKLTLPEPGRVQAAVDWLHERGLIRNQPTYSQLVDGRYLE